MARLRCCWGCRCQRARMGDGMPLTFGTAMRRLYWLRAYPSAQKPGRTVLALHRPELWRKGTRWARVARVAFVGLPSSASVTAGGHCRHTPSPRPYVPGVHAAHSSMPMGRPQPCAVAVEEFTAHRDRPGTRSGGGATRAAVTSATVVGSPREIDCVPWSRSLPHRPCCRPRRWSAHSCARWAARERPCNSWCHRVQLEAVAGCWAAAARRGTQSAAPRVGRRLLTAALEGGRRASVVSAVHAHETRKCAPDCADRTRSL